MRKRALFLSLIKGALCLLGAIPALNLWLALGQLNRHFIRAYDYRVLSLAIAETGTWAFVFLFVTLVCTPVQRLTGFRWPGELRRTFGLITFAYSLLHFVVYIVIGQKLRWDYAFLDAVGQKSRIPGWLALLLLVPLAVTSTDRMISWVGAKRWKNLHRLVYLATALAICHLAWTELENQTDFQRTKTVAWPFGILMVLRFLPLSSLRKKLRTSIPTRSSPDR